ncbi:MAG: EB domain-containing protein [Polyangiales bacterium]
MQNMLRWALIVSIGWAGGCGSTVDDPASGDAHDGAVKAEGGTADATDTTDADLAEGGEAAIPDAEVDTKPCPSTMGALVDRVADAVCAPLDDCCKKGGFPNDVAKCRAQTKTFLLPLFDHAACGGSVVDPPSLDACVTALHDFAAACRDRWDVYDDVTAACDHAMTGTKKPGESCKSVPDCEQPASPNYTTCLTYTNKAGKTVSMCEERDLGGVGAACGDWPDDPVVAHDCDPKKGAVCKDKTCVAYPVAGQPCVGLDCAEGLVCNSAKTCVTPVADGDDCSPSTSCGADSACVSGKCHRRADVGEPCSADSDCLVGTKGCVGGKCAPNNFIASVYAGSGTCTP